MKLKHLAFKLLKFKIFFMSKRSTLWNKDEASRGFYSVFFVIYLLMSSLLLDIVLVTPAYAYIDPNTGGFFFQAVAPVIYGVLGVIVIFWKRIKGFVKRIISRLGKQDNFPRDE